MTKLCSHCKEEKLIEEFGYKDKEKKKRRYICRSCMRLYLKSHYNNNVDYYVEKAKRQQVIYRRRTYQKIYDYLVEHPCVDCGETDPVVLEFDHLDKNTKIAEVSRLISDQKPWEFILAEIGKCEVRCANCHRRKTARQQGWGLYQLTHSEA